jgi:hypothetical protein
VFTNFSGRKTTVTALGGGVAAALVGGMLLTQPAFAGSSDATGATTAAQPAAQPAAQAAASSVSAATTAAKKRKLVTSNVSQLRKLGIQINESVLIDVADDGLNRYLNVGKKGYVNFTGTKKSDDVNKMMSLKPAKVTKKAKPAKNRVVIAPPFYNEDLGAGSCVADIKKGVLRLATCKAGKANQTWRVVPAGDSGQFELHGAHTKIRVNKGKITKGSEGYVGLQTIDFN